MSRDSSLTNDELLQVATEAYLYLYPMVLMENTRRNATNVPRDTKPGRAPMGVINHVREYPELDFKAVVRAVILQEFRESFCLLTNEKNQ